MNCPSCDEKSVPCIDTRPAPYGRRRRYKCKCGTRFSTIETMAHVGDHRGLDISPDEVKRWRQETLDEVETVLARELQRLREQFGISEATDE